MHRTPPLLASLALSLVAVVTTPGDAAASPPDALAPGLSLDSTVVEVDPGESEDAEPAYDATGKRDPFRGLAGEGPRPPVPGVLGDWELQQLRLVAVVEGESGRFALVEPPVGPAALLTEGSVLGEEGARVLQITPAAIVLRGERRLLDGTLFTDYELRLPDAGVALPEPAPGP